MLPQTPEQPHRLTLSKLVSPQDALRQKLEAGSRMPDGINELRVSRASIDTSIDNLKRKRLPGAQN
ncbi:MAG: hypothetical protein ABIL62_10165 [Planctomycetota bacterium]